MNKSRVFFALFLLSTFVIGCTVKTTQDEGSTTTPVVVSLTDGLDRSITLELPAKRIVSLAPSNTELLFDVGAGSQVIGRDSFSNYPIEAGQVRDIGGSMGQYNYEDIAALEPDLVLAAEINTPEQVRSLENLGLKVYYLSNPVDFDGLFDNIRTVGYLSGHDQESELLIGGLSARVADIETKLAGVISRPTVYYELDATDPASPYTIGSSTFGDYLITKAGGNNIGASIGEGWVQVSSEEILRINPDLILLGDVYAGVTPETVAARPGWEVLDAVVSGNVLPFNDDLMSRPTARLVAGLETLTELIHPEVFNK
ncbi:MAG: cobalamin-binding protein [Anaerolineaceae bacterium]